MNEQDKMDFSAVWYTIGKWKVTVNWCSDKNYNYIVLRNAYLNDVTLKFKISKKQAEEIIYNFGSKEIIKIMDRYKKITKCGKCKPGSLPPVKGQK